MYNIKGTMHKVQRRPYQMTWIKPNKDAVKAATDVSSGDVTWNAAALTDPVYPANIDLTFVDGDTSITAGTVVIEGTDAQDNVVSETITGIVAATSLTYSTDTAFKTLTKVTIALTGSGAADTLALSAGQKLGLYLDIRTSDDVIANLCSIAGAEATVDVGTINTTYQTVSFATAIDGTNDYVLIYKPEFVTRAKQPKLE